MNYNERVYAVCLVCTVHKRAREKKIVMAQRPQRG